MAQPRRTQTVSDIRVTLRLSPQEKEQIEQAAKAAGMTLSGYLRGTALETATQQNTGHTRAAGAAIP